MPAENKTYTYRPGQSAAVDQLIKAYEKLDGTALASREDAEERTPEDPFGLKTPPQGGREPARAMVDKFIKLLSWLVREYGLTDPADQLYAYELLSLNLLNAADCPLPLAQQVAVRREAGEFYKKATGG